MLLPGSKSRSETVLQHFDELADSPQKSEKKDVHANHSGRTINGEALQNFMLVWREYRVRTPAKPR